MGTVRLRISNLIITYMKKIVIDPADFSKIVQYIHFQPVSFQYLNKAMEVKSIIERATVMDIEMKQPEKKD